MTRSATIGEQVRAAHTAHLASLNDTDLWGEVEVASFMWPPRAYAGCERATFPTPDDLEPHVD